MKKQNEKVNEGVADETSAAHSGSTLRSGPEDGTSPAIANAPAHEAIPLRDLHGKRGELRSEITDAGAWGYDVQAKSIDGKEYMNKDGDEITKEWSTVQFRKADDGIGVPTFTKGHWARQIVSFHGYKSYEAAQALRWWLMAEFEEDRIATRIVKHYIQFAHRVFRTEYLDEQPPRDPEGETPKTPHP